MRINKAVISMMIISKLKMTPTKKKVPKIIIITAITKIRITTTAIIIITTIIIIIITRTIIIIITIIMIVECTGINPI